MAIWHVADVHTLSLVVDGFQQVLGLLRCQCLGLCVDESAAHMQATINPKERNGEGRKPVLEGRPKSQGHRKYLPTRGMRKMLVQYQSRLKIFPVGNRAVRALTMV